ncbi:MAG: IS1595 family transposase [Actinobacteria bacterium]|nr:IS1595 family transposase [Actinomycetota bacterium]
MPPVDRRNPIRAASSESTCSLLEFAREFPDDESCLVWLWRERFAPDGEHAHCSRCDAERVFKRYVTAQKRPCWFCQTCGHRIHPMAGTIFERSSTSLQLWFYAMYLMASTRCGISAKQLERELGVHYKTAWRMFNKIRNKLMTQEGAEPLAGSVEADETFVGGKPRESYRREVARRGWNMQTAYWDRKAIVFGAVQRGGKLRAEVIPDSRARTLDVKVREFVMPESILYTDDFQAYRQIGRKGYVHRRINHSARVYVMGDVHTQTIEGFFGLFKNGVRGVYHSVSQKWLQGYVNEYVWRYNRRDDQRSMFHELLGEAVSRAS